MAPPNPYLQRRSLGFPAQAEAQRPGQPPAHGIPYSPLPITTEASNSVQHIPSIPKYDVSVLDRPFPDLLPQSNTLGWGLDGAGKRPTLDLDSQSMPLVAPTNYQAIQPYASINTSPTYGSPLSSAGDTATPGMHAYSQHSPALPFLQASSGSSPSLLQSLQKQIRLPSSTVGRKAPRKSSFAPTQSTQNSPKILKRSTKSAVPSLRRSSLTQDSTIPLSASGRETPGNVIPRDMQSIPARPFPAGSKKAIASRKAHRTIVTQKTALDAKDKISPPATSIEIENEPESEPVLPPITTRGMVRAMKQYNRPQPRYDYEIPPELEGVQRALGPDDWTEYIMLSEKYVMGEVTEKELIAGSQRLFCAVNAKLHGRVQNMVVDLMIVPVVGNLAKSEVKKQVS